MPPEPGAVKDLILKYQGALEEVCKWEVQIVKRKEELIALIASLQALLGGEEE